MVDNGAVVRFAGVVDKVVGKAVDSDWLLTSNLDLIFFVGLVVLRPRLDDVAWPDLRRPGRLELFFMIEI